MNKGNKNPEDNDRETESSQVISRPMKTTDSRNLNQRLPSMHEIAPIGILSIVNVSVYMFITTVVPVEQQLMVLCFSALSMISIIVVHSEHGDRITDLLQNLVKIIVVDGIVGVFCTCFNAIRFAVCRLYDDFRLERILTYVFLALAMVYLRNSSGLVGATDEAGK